MMRTATYRTLRTSLRRRQVAADLAERRRERHQAQATAHTRWI